MEGHVAATALKPGAVLGQSADGLTNVIAELEDIARGEVAGFNSRVVGGFRELFPRLSKADYEKLRSTQLEEEPGALDALLGKFKNLSDGTRSMFAATRKLVRQPQFDGSYRLVVVPRVPEAKTEAQIVDVEAGEADTGVMVNPLDEAELAARPKKRTYTLAQILTDHSVMSKYALGLRAIETAKRLAATDPGAAAELFQSMMNGAQDQISVTVKAGDYSRDKVQARNTVRQICKDYKREQAAVQSQMTMDTLFMFGPGGESDWHIMGPLKNATEMSYIYWLVYSEGCVFPSLLLALELVLLGIDINNGTDCHEPVVEYHASRPDDDDVASGMSEEAMGMMSVDSRLAFSQVRERLLPVVAQDGRQLATAVRVTGRYVLINSHVLDADAGCTVNDNAVVVKSQISRDLWSVPCPGEATPWTFREPRVGELVVVCYLTNGELSCSAPLKVTSVDQSCVVTMLDDSVSYGMSGGALVALDDCAMLGVHSASTLSNLIAYRFGDKQFADLLDADSMTSFSHHSDVGSFAERVVTSFKKRGLWSVLYSAISALEPVFLHGEHVGMAVRNGEHTFTMCDAEQALRVGLGRRAAVFEAYGDHYYRTVSVEPGAPVYRRSPNYFEKVFVLGFDTEVYISAESTVTYVGPNARSFVIADLPAVDKPMLGGLVMGWDGAVLGCCGPRSVSTVAGLGFTCRPLEREEVPVTTSPRAVLASTFPFLNLVSWSDELLEEVFVHSSAGRYSDGRQFNAGMRPLANIGDNTAKAELYKSLRDVGLPHSQWSAIMQSLQSNAALAAVAWKLGYARAVTVGAGVVMQRDSKAYADLTEALIGAAALVEKPKVVHELCAVMGLLYHIERPVLERGVSDKEPVTRRTTFVLSEVDTSVKHEID